MRVPSGMRVRVCDRVNIYRGKKQSHSTNLSDSYDAISERERSQILRESRRNDDRKYFCGGIRPEEKIREQPLLTRVCDALSPVAER